MKTANVVQVDFSKPKALRLDDKVLLRDVWRALGEPRGDYSTWVVEKLEHYEKGSDFQTRKSEELNFIGKKVGRVEHVVTVQVALEIAANGHGETGHRVRRFFGECVRLLNETRPELVPTHTLPDAISADFLEQIAARMRAIEKQAQEDRKRALTSMGTAGGLAKTNSELRDRLGDGKNWLTVVAAQKRHPELASMTPAKLGALLRRASLEAGTGVRKVPDARWGEVNAYHTDIVVSVVQNAGEGQ
jgi:phage anti-repressor protein